MTVTTKTVEIDGLPVEYGEIGPTNPVKDESRTILFLHGAGGASPAGADFMAMLGQRHRLLMPSRPGFDGTPAGTLSSNQEVASLIAGFVKAVADEPVHAVGQSAGTTCALWLAVQNPELVASLTLSAPAAFAVRREPPAGPPDPAAMARRLYGTSPLWSAPPTEAERARIQKNAQAYQAMYKGNDGKAELEGRLKEIACQTLVLWATADEMLAPESMAPYQREIENCYRMFIYGAAHELPISAGERWVSLVDDFVTRGEAFIVNPGVAAQA